MSHGTSGAAFALAKMAEQLGAHALGIRVVALGRLRTEHVKLPVVGPVGSELLGVDLIVVRGSHVSTGRCCSVAARWLIWLAFTMAASWFSTSAAVADLLRGQCARCGQNGMVEQSAGKYLVEERRLGRLKGDEAAKDV